jgi:PAS domain S-box-containing protein
MRPSAFSIDQQESSRLFKLLVDTVTDYAIFLLDVDGKVMTWNAGAQRFKGYLAHEIIGKHFSLFYTEPDLVIRKPWHELEVAAEVGRFEDEGWRLRKDGTRFWANVIIIAIRDADGTLLGFGKITRDLTERREAELRYRILVEGVNDYAIYMLDANGIVTSWNSGAQSIKGYTADEIIGSHFSLFYTPEDIEAKLPQKVLQAAAEQGHFEGEGWRVRKNGTRFWCSAVVTPLYDEDGILRGFSKVTRDITDRKNLLDEVKRHAAELEIQVQERERTNAELESFSYSVSHDLRAPLRAIEGFSTALREDFGELLPPEGLEYLDEIASASVRMSRLVQDLLNYSRLNKLDMPLVAVSVIDSVDEAIRELGEARAAIDVEVPLNLEVIAHRVTLVQVLANLLANGLKFHSGDRQPKVRVSARRESGNAVIQIQDNGIGIEERYLDRIFKVFERLHGTDKFPGTGIGLAIVKRGLERMSGNIFVASQIGVGTTFTITLPTANTERNNS